MSIQLLSLPLIFKITLVVIGYKIYNYLTTGRCKSEKRLDGKTVIITGANTGIGKETAVDLVRRGARVILACRDMSRANEALNDIVLQTGKRNVVVRRLDLASLTSVRDFAAGILQNEPRLDVLINNAGCCLTKKIYIEDGLEMQMASNHLGHFLLTNLLLELLCKTENSRIVNVSALAHKFCTKLDVSDLNFRSRDRGNRFFEIYSATKLCNILFTTELAQKLSDAGKKVTVNALHPGVIHTEFTRFLPGPLQRFTAPFTRFLLKSASDGAQTTIHLAVSDEVAGTTGKYFSDCKEASVSKLASDKGLAKKLWEASETLVGLKPEENFFTRA